MDIITNTLGVHYFSGLDIEDANVVVVLSADKPLVAFLRVDESEDAEAAVRNYLWKTCVGCNYLFKIEKVVGSTFFCDPKPRL